MGSGHGRPAPHPAACRACHGSHADAGPCRSGGARNQAGRLGGAHVGPARGAAGADDAAGADRSVLAAGGREMEDRPQGTGQRRAVPDREERPEDADRSGLRTRRRIARCHREPHHPRGRRAGISRGPFRRGHQCRRRPHHRGSRRRNLAAGEDDDKCEVTLRRVRLRADPVRPVLRGSRRRRHAARNFRPSRRIGDRRRRDRRRSYGFSLGSILFGFVARGRRFPRDARHGHGRRHGVSIAAAGGRRRAAAGAAAPRAAGSPVAADSPAAAAASAAAARRAAGRRPERQ